MLDWGDTEKLKHWKDIAKKKNDNQKRINVVNPNTNVIIATTATNFMTPYYNYHRVFTTIIVIIVLITIIF